MKQVILIDHEPWTLTRKNLFFDLLEAAGISLKVFDVSNYLYPGYKIHGGDINNAEYLTKITNEKQLVEACGTINEGDIIILECFKRWNSRKIFKLIRERGAKIVKLELYGNTKLEKRKSDILKRITLRRIPEIAANQFRDFCLKLYFKRHRVNGKFDYVISSSALDHPDFNINHPDYDKFKWAISEPVVNGKYFVFCDIFFPYHPDLIFFEKIRNIPNADKYHNALNKFFDKIEEKYNIPVVIAAHPKSNYSGNEFGGRSIIKYQTDNLIKYSEGVIMHLSNSVSFALLNDKPIIFIATEDLMKTARTGVQFRLLAEKTLGMKIWDIDHPVASNEYKLEKVDECVRKDYIYTFLTSEESEERTNVENIKYILSKIIAE